MTSINADPPAATLPPPKNFSLIVSSFLFLTTRTSDATWRVNGFEWRPGDAWLTTAAGRDNTPQGRISIFEARGQRTPRNYGHGIAAVTLSKWQLPAAAHAQETSALGTRRCSSNHATRHSQIRTRHRGRAVFGGLAGSAHGLCDSDGSLANPQLFFLIWTKTAGSWFGSFLEAKPENVWRRFRTFFVDILCDRDVSERYGIWIILIINLVIYSTHIKHILAEFCFLFVCNFFNVLL